MIYSIYNSCKTTHFIILYPIYNYIIDLNLNSS